MGRKPAPQPLTLPESNPVASSTSNDQQQRIAPAETLQVNLSPADSRSPRSPKSPRSPFRFHNKKSPSSSTSPSATQAQHLQHQQQDQQPQSWRPSDEHPYPPISSALEQVPSQNPTEKRGDASDWPNSQDNGRNNNATTNKASRHQHKSSQQSLRSQHQRHGEDKSSKSGFFFNFGKSGKSTDRLASHQKSESRADTMSRGSDNSTVTKQNSKQSGKTLMLEHEPDCGRRALPRPSTDPQSTQNRPQRTAVVRYTEQTIHYLPSPAPLWLPRSTTSLALGKRESRSLSPCSVAQDHREKGTGKVSSAPKIRKRNNPHLRNSRKSKSPRGHIQPEDNTRCEPLLGSLIAASGT